MPRIDDDRCKFIKTKQKKCSRKANASKNKLKIPQINQQNQEDITISHNLDAMTLTTSGDSASEEEEEEEEEDIEKAMKRAHHNDLEKERRKMERSAYNGLKDSLSDATGETPKSRREILAIGEEHITSERDTVIPNLAGSVAVKLRQNATLTRHEQILKTQLVSANEAIPKLPRLPQSPERDPQTSNFLDELEHINLNMPQMSHNSSEEAETFDRLKRLVHKYTGVVTTSPEQDLLLADQHLNSKVKQSKKDKKELKKVLNKLKNHLADASNE